MPGGRAQHPSDAHAPQPWVHEVRFRVREVHEVGFQGRDGQRVQLAALFSAAPGLGAFPTAAQPAGAAARPGAGALPEEQAAHGGRVARGPQELGADAAQPHVGGLGRGHGAAHGGAEAPELGADEHHEHAVAVEALKTYRTTAVLV